MQRITVSSTVRPTIGQQIFTIGSAIAGGLAGMIVAREFSQVEEVPTNQVIFATAISVIFTVAAAVYLAKQVNQESEIYASR